MPLMIVIPCQHAMYAIAKLVQNNYSFTCGLCLPLVMNLAVDIVSITHCNFNVFRQLGGISITLP